MIDDAGDAERLPGYGLRFDRVLLLSATPLESDDKELWCRPDLFGFGGRIKALADPELDDSRKKDIASRFLVRRLTGLSMAGEKHTKSMVRREWRGGGCNQYDEPLQVPDQRPRVIEALIQKKVAEILQDERFNASFQIGMLSSFESFYRTAKVKLADRP